MSAQIAVQVRVSRRADQAKGSERRNLPAGGGTQDPCRRARKARKFACDGRRERDQTQTAWEVYPQQSGSLPPVAASKAQRVSAKRDSWGSILRNLQRELALRIRERQIARRSPMAKSSPSQRKTSGRIMHEFKHGELKSGKGGKGGKVKSRKQAIAIAMHEAGTSKKESKSENKRSLAKSKRKESKGETSSKRKRESRMSARAASAKVRAPWAARMPRAPRAAANPAVPQDVPALALRIKGRPRAPARSAKPPDTTPLGTEIPAWRKMTWVNYSILVKPKLLRGRKVLMRSFGMGAFLLASDHCVCLMRSGAGMQNAPNSDSSQP